ncbi:MAG: serine--tRNA ligase, partial [Clostridiales bacterium]|nr:serine--tRNA ligase [Clostridiales bacterium]
MIDINLIRNQPDLVRENIKKKFQDAKLPLVDEVIDLDLRYRAAIQQADALRSKRKTISKQIGALIGQGKQDEAEAVKSEVN